MLRLILFFLLLLKSFEYWNFSFFCRKDQNIHTVGGILLCLRWNFAGIIELNDRHNYILVTRFYLKTRSFGKKLMLIVHQRTYYNGMSWERWSVCVCGEFYAENIRLPKTDRGSWLMTHTHSLKIWIISETMIKIFNANC